MKKWLLIFSLLATTIIYSMDQEEREISHAFAKLDFVKIEELCKKGAINFKKEFSIIYKFPSHECGMSKTPFDFALYINNLELGELLVGYGAEPDTLAYQELCCWGHYQFLPILYKYHSNGGDRLFGGNLLHRAVDTHVPENSHKLIAGILLFFPDYAKQKAHFDNGSQSNLQFNKLTPLEYAKSGWSLFRDSAQKAVEILENENLLNETMDQVAKEFKLKNLKDIQKVGIHSYLQGRELGISLHEMQEQQNFLKRNIQLLENTKEEEE
jgi:hypothetical protein